MNKNPFASEALPETKKENTRLNLYSNTNDVSYFSENKKDILSKKATPEKLLKLAFKKITALAKEYISRITNPIISKTKDTSSFFMANKSIITGNHKHSDTYQLLNLLTNKKPNISHKAELALELKLKDPESRKIILNFFNHNKNAKNEYKYFYEKLINY